MKPIWIVDDDPSIRFVLEKALGREGWPIRSFTQARDVLKALADVDSSDPERQAPQVLVSDIRMPVIDGLALASCPHHGLPPSSLKNPLNTRVQGTCPPWSCFLLTGLERERE